VSDLAEEEAMVAKAVAHAVKAGVPGEDIDRELQQAALDDDDFRHVVCAGRLYALMRLRRLSSYSGESPVMPPKRDPNPW
jgi:hypothetical protein